MKIAALIARIFLGLTFLVFGLDEFVHFIPASPPMVGDAGAYIGALIHSHYVFIVGAFEVVGGLLLLINRYVPLELVLVVPVIVNILAFHMTMEPSGLPVAIVLVILWAFLAWRFRAYFAPSSRRWPCRNNSYVPAMNEQASSQDLEINQSTQGVRDATKPVPNF